jgi:hypothetical protein
MIKIGGAIFDGDAGPLGHDVFDPGSLGQYATGDNGKRDKGDDLEVLGELEKFTGKLRDTETGMDYFGSRPG